jgi:uncharacterized Zn ribbon protein
MVKRNGAGTVTCEMCKKPLSEMVFERKNKIVCSRCAEKIDGREHQERTTEDDE